ncbi:hypothetical protein DB895_07220 [Flavobacterium psychrotolerans]|uniref:Uncharacterized protein n=1 Tax=Flavobacterium psychrotolerans TaxID=2169410 RepID=A0A2U1JK54_9FLAO|nr:hypothetical protein DB895_07220 [Flavobacterium psychrotolerans]
MSAGIGIQHSEMNPSMTEVAKTLQLRVFPKKKMLFQDMTKNHLILKAKSIPLYTLFPLQIKMKETRSGRTNKHFLI